MSPHLNSSHLFVLSTNTRRITGISRAPRPGNFLSRGALCLPECTRLATSTGARDDGNYDHRDDGNFVADFLFLQRATCSWFRLRKRLPKKLHFFGFDSQFPTPHLVRKTTILKRFLRGIVKIKTSMPNHKICCQSTLHTSHAAITMRFTTLSCETQ